MTNMFNKVNAKNKTFYYELNQLFGHPIDLGMLCEFKS